MAFSFPVILIDEVLKFAGRLQMEVSTLDADHELELTEKATKAMKSRPMGAMKKKQ
jgi:hypothetical protein